MIATHHRIIRERLPNLRLGPRQKTTTTEDQCHRDPGASEGLHKLGSDVAPPPSCRIYCRCPSQQLKSRDLDTLKTVSLSNVENYLSGAQRFILDLDRDVVDSKFSLHNLASFLQHPSAH